MTRILLLALTLIGCLPCMAATGSYFLRTPGSINLVDATNRMTVVVTEDSDHTASVKITWRLDENSTTSIDLSLGKSGWFVFAKDASHVWLFDGKVLSLQQKDGRKQSGETLSETDKRCPQEVREALAHFHALKN